MSAPAVFRRRVEVNFGAIHKCKGCKATVRVDWTHAYTAVGGYYAQKLDHNWSAAQQVHVAPSWGNRCDVPSVRCQCGETMPGKRIVGRTTEHECDARCMNSRGHVCECSCGGRNHGANLVMIAGGAQ